MFYVILLIFAKITSLDNVVLVDEALKAVPVFLLFIAYYVL